GVVDGERGPVDGEERRHGRQGCEHRDRLPVPARRLAGRGEREGQRERGGRAREGDPAPRHDLAFGKAWPPDTDREEAPQHLLSKRRPIPPARRLPKRGAEGPGAAGSLGSARALEARDAVRRAEAGRAVVARLPVAEVARAAGAVA